MWSMWNAPSDRDYYGPQGSTEPEERRELTALVMPGLARCVRSGVRAINPQPSRSQ